MPNRLLTILLACLLPSPLTSAAQTQPTPAAPKVAVHHVEAPETPNTPAYAAINFGTPTPSAPTTRRSIPANPVTQERPFANLEFIGLGDSGRTFSNHAHSVGGAIYGESSAAAGRVSTVYAQPAFPWLQSLGALRAPALTSPPPQAFPPGVVVSNHSWVNRLGDHYVNGELIRRADFAAARDNVVLVTGAVCGGPFAGVPLMWSCQNALAAAGDDPQTPFDPATATHGKNRADIWWPGKASYATARASSAVALLASIARENPADPKNPEAYNDATRSVVLRSLILTGADKTGHWRDPIPYPRNLPNHLRPTTGAGRLNPDHSRAILSANPIAPSRTNDNGIIIGTPQLQPRGWSRLVLKPTESGTPDQRLILFELTENAPTFQATATTNATQLQRRVGNNLLIDSRPESRILPAITLALRRVTTTTGGLTLAPTSDDPNYLSAAPNDTVQHLYLESGLPAGRYALVITGDPKYPCEVGLSFDTREPAKLPPPEKPTPPPTQPR
jgi:hypothetical protein